MVGSIHSQVGNPTTWGSSRPGEVAGTGAGIWMPASGFDGHDVGESGVGAPVHEAALVVPVVRADLTQPPIHRPRRRGSVAAIEGTSPRTNSPRSSHLPTRVVTAPTPRPHPRRLTGDRPPAVPTATSPSAAGDLTPTAALSGAVRHHVLDESLAGPWCLVMAAAAPRRPGAGRRTPTRRVTVIPRRSRGPRPISPEAKWAGVHDCGA